MPDTIDLLTYRSLSTAINEMKSPNNFLRDAFFGSRETHPTEGVELGYFTNSRRVAPFVKKNGSAVMVDGVAGSFKTLDPTNIRIKRPFKAHELLFRRTPGMTIFPGRQSIAQQARRSIARDLQSMNDEITNAEEWLCSQAIQGSITYEVDEQESFTIDFGRPSGHTIVLTGDRCWNAADPTTPRPDLDAHVAKRLLSDEVELQPTDCLLGEEAADYFLKLAAQNPVFDGQRKLDQGEITLQTQFQESGVIYLGRAFGIRFWEYSRSALLSGVSTPMVRSKYAEFLCRTPRARMKIHYGAIADIKTLRGSRFQAQRFAKSWEQEDPSALMALSATRPLPALERPGCIVSVKVVSG